MVTCPYCESQFNYRARSIKRAQLVTHNVNGRMEFELILPEGATPEIIPKLFEYGFGEQAVITGLIGAGLGLMIGTPLAALINGYELHIVVVSVTAGVVGGLLFLHDYSARQMAIVRHLWHSGQIAWHNAEQDRSPQPVQFIERNEQGSHIEIWPALPVDMARFNRWCVAVVSGQSLGYAHWTGASKLFNKTTEYIPLLDYLKARRMVVDKGSNIGHVLTESGKKRLGEYAKIL